MSRRRKPVKDVRCIVQFIAGGKTVKTVRRRLSMAQTLREIGGDTLGVEGRLRSGAPFKRKRSVVRGISVALTYVADNKIGPAEVVGVPCDIKTMQGIIQSGIPL